jgi:hypothetical protein
LGRHSQVRFRRASSVFSTRVNDLNHAALVGMTYNTNMRWAIDPLGISGEYTQRIAPAVAGHDSSWNR